MNLYAYVGNDPINLTDPTGEQALAFGPRLFTPPSVTAQQQAETQLAIARSNAIALPPLIAAGAVGGFCATGGCGLLAMEVLAGESLGPAGLATIGGGFSAAAIRTGAVSELGDSISGSTGQIFHRLNNNSTQTPEVSRLVQNSGELFGTPPRGSDLPTVQAFNGPLPPNASGFEFSTSAIGNIDNIAGTSTRFRPGDRGVELRPNVLLPNGQTSDVAVIPCCVLKIQD